MSGYGITYICAVERKNRAPEALVAHYFGGDLDADADLRSGVRAGLSGWVYDPSLTEKKFDNVYNGRVEGRLLEARVCRGGPTGSRTFGKIQWMIDPDGYDLKRDEAGMRCGWAVRTLTQDELERQSDLRARDGRKFFNDYKILPVYSADLKELNHPDRGGSGIVRRLYYISEDPNIRRIKIPRLWRVIEAIRSAPQGIQGFGGTSSMMMAPQETSLTALETSGDASVSSQVPAAGEAQAVQTSDNSAPATDAPQSDTRDTVEDEKLKFNEVQAPKEPDFADSNVLETFKALLADVGVDQTAAGADMFYKDFEVSLQTDQEAEARMQSEPATANT